VAGTATATGARIEKPRGGLHLTADVFLGFMDEEVNVVLQHLQLI